MGGKVLPELLIGMWRIRAIYWCRLCECHFSSVFVLCERGMRGDTIQSCVSCLVLCLGCLRGHVCVILTAGVRYVGCIVVSGLAVVFGG